MTDIKYNDDCVCGCRYYEHDGKGCLDCDCAAYKSRIEARFEALWDALPDCDHEDNSPAKCGVKATQVDYTLCFWCDEHIHSNCFDLPYASVVRAIEKGEI